MEQKICEIEVNGIVYVPKIQVEKKVSENGLPAVLVRSYAAGVHFGFLLKKEETLSGVVVTLANSRRVWSWSGAASLSQMAVEGVKNPDKCKFAMEVDVIEIANCIEIIPLTQEAYKNLTSVEVWKVG